MPEVFAEYAWVPAVAESGDVALVASMIRARTLDQHVRTAPDSTALLVRQADGRVEKVLTFRELVDAGMLDRSALGRSRGWIAVAFPAADRIVLHVQDGAGRLRFRSFYEVVDPNGDGDWSDREVTPLGLPAFLGFERPVSDPAAGWYPNRLAVEPSVGGEDRSRSFLLMVQRFGLGENRVYRVSDRNHDGDARDTGEFKLLFSRTPTGEFGGAMAPRVVVRDGTVALRELILGGFTTRTRVSRVSESGEVTDVARAFFRVDGVAADPEGNIYVLGVLPNADASGLFKLKPVPVGAPEGAAESPATTTTPSGTAPAVTAPAPPPELQRMAVGRYGSAGAEFFLLGANGRTLGALPVSGGTNTGLGLQSPRATRYTFWSDREIPNEAFVYVARATGGTPKKISDETLNERYLDVACWPSETSLLLTYQRRRPAQGPEAVVLHDVRSGKKRVLVRNAWVRSLCTADGRLVLVSTGVDYSKTPPAGKERVELLDLRTGKRRLVLGRPDHGGEISDTSLSPDGTRVAYVLELDPEPDGDARAYSVHVKELATGRTVQVMRAKTQGIGAAYPTWSPAGDRVLLAISRPPPGGPCTEKEASDGSTVCQFWDLALVDAESGAPKRIASLLQDSPDTSWSPNGQTLAYSAGTGVFVVRMDGTTRKLPRTTGYRLFGWSPDGRYLGLVRQSPFWTSGKSTRRAIAVLELATGKMRTVFETQAEWLAPTWWR